jgi:hypothetical protein
MDFNQFFFAHIISSRAAQEAMLWCVIPMDYEDTIFMH